MSANLVPDSSQALELEGGTKTIASRLGDWRAKNGGRQKKESSGHKPSPGKSR